MTPEELKSALDKATPGEWEVGGPHPHVSVIVERFPATGWSPSGPPQEADFDAVATGLNKEDAAFIVAAKKHLPAILTELSTIKAKLAEAVWLVDYLKCLCSDSQSAVEMIGTFKRGIDTLPLITELSTLRRQVEEARKDTERLDLFERLNASVNRLSVSQFDRRELWHFYYTPPGEYNAEHINGKPGEPLRNTLDTALQQLAQRGEGK